MDETELYFLSFIDKVHLQTVSNQSKRLRILYHKLESSGAAFRRKCTICKRLTVKYCDQCSDNYRNVFLCEGECNIKYHNKNVDIIN